MHTRRKNAGLAPRGAIGACSFFKLYTAAPLLHEIHAVIAAHARQSTKARTLAQDAALCLAQFAPPRQPTITHPLRPARARARPPPPRFAASAACSTIESAAGRPRPVRGGFGRRCMRGVGIHERNAGLGLLQSTCAEWRRAATCKRGVRALDNILADLPTRAAMTRGAGGAAKARGEREGRGLGST